MRNLGCAATYVLCVSGLFSFGLAQAAGQGFFVDAGVGLTNPDTNADSDTAYRAGLGYRWAVGEQADVGIHAGYVDLGTVVTGSMTTIDINGSVTRPFNVEAHLATLGVDARIGLAPQWHVDLRGGYLRGHLEANAPRILIEERDPHGWTAGVGIGYDMSEHWAIDVGYDEYRLNVPYGHFNIGMADVGMEYRF